MSTNPRDDEAHSAWSRHLDTEFARAEVQACTRVCDRINVSTSSEQIPIVPRQLDFREEEENRDEEGPAPSMETSESKPKWRRGQHGRHQRELTDVVHVILEVGPEGNPVSPQEVLGQFSNQVSCIVREKILGRAGTRSQKMSRAMYGARLPRSSLIPKVHTWRSVVSGHCTWRPMPFATSS